MRKKEVKDEDVVMEESLATPPKTITKKKDEAPVIPPVTKTQTPYRPRSGSPSLPRTERPRRPLTIRLLA